MKYRLLKDLVGLYTGAIFERGPDGLFGTIECNRNANPQNVAPVDKRWKPENRETYYLIYMDNTGGEIGSSRWSDNSVHKDRWLRSNCFRTDKQAEEAAKRIKQTLLDYHKEIAYEGK